MILWLLVFFPFWGVFAFYFLPRPPWRVLTFLMVVFFGGCVSLFMTFVSNGGAGGSSQLSSSGWEGMISSLVIQYLILFCILVVGNTSTNQQQDKSNMEDV
ncbi:MAG: hypothetical protein D3916_15795 [Candidatus Electrothrix sp. MAN1_4]|nr:hypothetical protein [Candidatus Electrothrix sp. MAN1_4]